MYPLLGRVMPHDAISSLVNFKTLSGFTSPTRLRKRFQILSAAMRSGLSSKGVRFVDSKTDATVKIAVRANTKAVGESQGFSSTFLNYDIEIRDAKTNASVFNLSKSNVKGVDMDFEKAGTKAYRNLAKNLEAEIISNLKNKIY